MCCIFLFVTFPYVSWSTLQLRVSWILLNMFSPTSIFDDHSNTVLSLWILFDIYVACLSLLCCLGTFLKSLLVLPSEKGLTTWLSCVLALTHMVFWVRDGSWLYRNSRSLPAYLLLYHVGSIFIDVSLPQRQCLISQNTYSYNYCQTFNVRLWQEVT